jgi:hypothetical protein
MDLYSKTVLTVIAAALVTLCLQQALSPAIAQGSSCGHSRYSPCYVELVR